MGRSFTVAQVCSVMVVAEREHEAPTRLGWNQSSQADSGGAERLAQGTILSFMLALGLHVSGPKSAVESTLVCVLVEQVSLKLSYSRVTQYRSAVSCITESSCGQGLTFTHHEVNPY